MTVFLGLWFSNWALDQQYSISWALGRNAHSPAPCPWNQGLEGLEPTSLFSQGLASGPSCCSLPEFGNHRFRIGYAQTLPPLYVLFTCVFLMEECSPRAQILLGFFCFFFFPLPLRSNSLLGPPPCVLCCLLSLPTSEVLLGFPFSLPGVSVGPHGSLLLLGVLGSNSICGCNQRHCAGEMAVFLKALSPLAQETDPK